MAQGSLRTILSILLAAMGCSRKTTDTVVAITGPKSPDGLTEALRLSFGDYFSQTSAELTIVNIVHRDALDAVTDRTALVIEATYSQFPAYQVIKICEETAVPVVILSPFKHKSVYNLQPTYAEFASALKTLKQYFAFQTVNVLCDLSEFSASLIGQIAEAEANQYDIQTVSIDMDISRTIGDIVRPKGNRVTVFATEPQLTLEAIRAQKRMHIGGLGYANIYPISSILYNRDASITDEELSGAVIIAPTGCEFSRAGGDYLVCVLSRLFAHLFESLASLSSAVSLRSHTEPEFSVINQQGSARVIVGSITGEKCRIDKSVVFPGNSRLVPSNATAPIPFSGNLGNLDSRGGYYPLFYYFAGVRIALEELEQRRDVLPGFSLDLWNFTGNYLSFDAAFLSNLLLPNRAKIGTAILTTVSSMFTIPFARFLLSVNITTPVIGSSASYPELSSRSAFPNYIRTCISDDYMNLVTIQVLQRLGWSQYAIVVGNSSWGLEALDAFERLSAQSGVAIANSKEYRVLNPVAGDSAATEHYTEALKHFISTRARVLVVVGQILASTLPLRLYELGLRRGDVVIVARDWLLNNVFISLNKTDVPKVEEIMSGSFQVSQEQYVGKIGEAVGGAYRRLHGRDPPAYACFYYDSTLTLAYALDWMLATGRDYMNSTQMMSALRSTRFVGCSGTVSFEPHTNDRSTMRYVLATMSFPSGAATLSEIGHYDPQGMTLLSFSPSFVWADGTHTVPPDYRNSSFGCQFEDRLIHDFPYGRLVLYLVCSGTVLVAIASSFAAWRLGPKVRFERLRERREMTLDDVLVMLGVVVETLQGLSLGPNFGPFLRSLWTWVEISTWEFQNIAESYERLAIFAESVILSWIILRGSLWVCTGSHHPCSQIIAEKLVFMVENWLFVPILSVLLKTFACVEGIAEYDATVEFRSSFLRADCSLFCWKDRHIPQVVLSAAAIAVFLPAASVFRPLWQSSSASLHIHTRHSYLLSLTSFQVICVSLAEMLRKQHPIPHAIAFLAVWGVHTVELACWEVYGYRRMQLWSGACRSAVMWTGAVSLVRIAVGGGTMENVYIGIVAVGWSLILILALAYQTLRVPSLLYRKPGVNTLYLFKFAFQPTKAAVVQQLNQEFKRTGQSRRVSVRMSLEPLHGDAVPALTSGEPGEEA